MCLSTVGLMPEKGANYGGSDCKKIHLQCRRPGFDPWVGKIPWRRDQLTTMVSLPREFHGQRGAWQATVHGVLKESGTTERLTLPQTFLSYSFIGVMEEQDQGTSRFDS